MSPKLSLLTTCTAAMLGRTARYVLFSVVDHGWPIVDPHVRQSVGFMFASRQGTCAIRATQRYGKELLANRACRSLRTAVALQQTSRPFPTGSLSYQTCCSRQQWQVCCSAAQSSQSQLTLILYSKPGCHLCDGLKVQPHVPRSVLHASVSCTCHLHPAGEGTGRAGQGCIRAFSIVRGRFGGVVVSFGMHVQAGHQADNCTYRFATSWTDQIGSAPMAWSFQC